MADMTIEIPDPALVLLVGPAGAGKTTFARRHFAPDEIVGSDELRAAIAGDPRDQTRNRAVFGALHRATERRLQAGLLVVVDATNTTAAARRPLLAIARRTGVGVVAIVLDVTLEEARARNAGRERVVDPAVIERHHVRLMRLLEGHELEREGCAAVHILRTGPGDVIRVVRQAATTRLGARAEQAPG